MLLQREVVGEGAIRRVDRLLRPNGEILVEIGQFALILALLLAIAQSTLPLWGASRGDIALIAKGTMHQVKNVGDGPATYMIAAVGGDIKA